MAMAMAMCHKSYFGLGLEKVVETWNEELRIRITWLLSWGGPQKKKVSNPRPLRNQDIQWMVYKMSVGHNLLLCSNCWSASNHGDTVFIHGLWSHNKVTSVIWNHVYVMYGTIPIVNLPCFMWHMYLARLICWAWRLVIIINKHGRMG